MKAPDETAEEIKKLRKALADIAFTDCGDCYQGIAYAGLGGRYANGYRIDSRDDLE